MPVSRPVSVRVSLFASVLLLSHHSHAAHESSASASRHPASTGASSASSPLAAPHLEATPYLAEGARTKLLSAIESLTKLKNEVLAAELEFAGELAHVVPERRSSAINLVHYIAVRRHDLRPLQDDLHELGLSSLGSAESHVLSSLDAVIKMGNAALNSSSMQSWSPPNAVSFSEGRSLLKRNSIDALGLSPPRHATR